MAGCRTHGLAVEFTDLTYKGKRTHDLPVKVTNSLQTACTYTQKGRVVPNIIILLSKQIPILTRAQFSTTYFILALTSITIINQDSHSSYFNRLNDVVFKIL